MNKTELALLANFLSVRKIGPTFPTFYFTKTSTTPFFPNYQATGCYRMLAEKREIEIIEQRAVVINLAVKGLTDGEGNSWRYVGDNAPSRQSRDGQLGRRSTEDELQRCARLHDNSRFNVHKIKAAVTILGAKN